MTPFSRRSSSQDSGSAMTRLFVSDVHLDAAALYILGDLFETWVGDDDPDPTKGRICEGLRALTANGVGCFVLHGNRDFLLGRDFCRRTGSRLRSEEHTSELQSR